MTQTPQAPPGWYPQGNQERWWDGTQWSDNFRPIQAPATAPPPMGYAAAPVGYGAPQAPGVPPTYAVPQQSHWARNCLIVFAVVFLLGLGGCVALGLVVKDKVDETINDKTPGGPNVPLDITPGQAFSVKHFDYKAGWTVAADAAGDASITDLTVTNNRSKADFLFVHVDLRQGSTILATIQCALPNGARIAKGDTVTLTCTSTDPMPAAYDRVTINDDI